MAGPGDTVTIRGGTYLEAIRTTRGGTATAPITLRPEPGTGPVLITAAATVLRVDHPYIVIEDIAFDGQYANAVAVAVGSRANFLVLRGIEVRHSGRDCIGLLSPESVLIEDSTVHHCLYPANGGSDAHGIVAGAVRNLTIRNTDIHTFSGDGVQVDPTRDPAGWDSVTIERCRIWLSPLTQAENGFPAGSITGENAVDTKTPDTGARARLVVRDVLAWGFRGRIENQAAFNLKENVDALIDGVTVWDSELAFRVRGPTTHPGAWVTVQNSVIYNVDAAVRYEDNIENLRVWNDTFGANVSRPFVAASSRSSGVDVRNLLMIGSSLPSEAFDRSNLAVGSNSFLDAPVGDYHLFAMSPAVDAGSPITSVIADRDGRRRPQGLGPDIGAYEWTKPTVLSPPADLLRPLSGKDPSARP